MPKLGKKFRTLHKFGQRRKKKKNKGKIDDCGDGDREQTNSAASSSASDPADTTTASSSSVSVAVSSSSSTTPGASTSTSTETSSLQETLTQKPCSFKRKMDMFTSSVAPSDSEDEYDVDTSECAKKKAKKKADAVGVDETDPERQNHNGVVAVIEVFTGLVIDFIALSNYCRECETGPNANDEGYRAWYTSHRPKCQKNFEGTSGAMESEGAVILFQRSLELFKFRYTSLMGDGDAKTHLRVLQADPYDGRDIKRLQCTNHVAKSMGTALRKLVAAHKGTDESISGKGKLTDVRIKELTNYYGKAIKSHAGTLQEMEVAVWATFFHTISTNDNPQHDLCPKGSQSWCFYQRAIAEDREPRDHRRPLPPVVVRALKPVYQRLGDPQLLIRCIDGKTSNSNESFHSLLWSICPKERWGSLRTIEAALALAVQKYNKGSTALIDMLLQLELATGPSLEEYVEKADNTRVKTATRKSSGKERAKRTRMEIACCQEQQEREGPQYEAGRF